MTIKSKLTFLSLLVAVMATSFATVSAYADEGELGEKQPQMKQHMEEMKAAFENGDYDAIAAMYQERTGQDLSEEQFGVMQEAHAMMQEGDKEGAKALIEESGLELPKMHQQGKGKFMEDLTDEQKEVMEEARALKEEGDIEGAKALLEDAEIPLPPKKGNFNKGCKFGQ